MNDSFTFRYRDPETGMWHEIEITAAQALDLAAGEPISIPA